MAQGAVSGRVSIVERPGARTTDLADAVVWLEPRGGTGALGRSHPQIVMESREFVPRVRVVGVGSAVGFPNQDPFRHNVFSKAGPGEFDLGLYGRGESKDAHVERAGVYPVFCNIHSKMNANILVVPGSLYTKVGADGTYRIENVPVGARRVVAWSPSAKPVQQKIEVSSGGGQANFTLDIEAAKAHTNKLGQPYGSYKE